MSNGRSFTFDTTDLGGDNYRLFVLSHNMPSMPAPKLDIQSLGGANGSIIQGACWEHLVIELECFIAAASESAAETCIENVLAVLKTAQEGEKAFILDDFPYQQYSVRLASGIDGKLAKTGAAFPLKFIAPDPWPTILKEEE